jgi:hypothetical protein
MVFSTLLMVGSITLRIKHLLLLSLELDMMYTLAITEEIITQIEILTLILLKIANNSTITVLSSTANTTYLLKLMRLEKSQDKLRLPMSAILKEQLRCSTLWSKIKLKL